MKSLRTIVPLLEGKRQDELRQALAQHIEQVKDSPDFRTKIADKTLSHQFGIHSSTVTRYLLSLGTKRTKLFDPTKGFELRKQGLPDREIANHFGLKTAWHVTNLLDNKHSAHPNYHPKNQKHGGARPKSRAIHADNVHQAFEMRQQGKTDEEIGRHFGLGKHHVTQVLDKEFQDHPDHHPKNYKKMGRPRAFER